jgi:hypothetical protein
MKFNVRSFLEHFGIFSQKILAALSRAQMRLNFCPSFFLLASVVWHLAKTIQCQFLQTTFEFQKLAADCQQF